MVIKVGINGFGRIGRVIFRSCVQSSDIELSAINDPAIDAEYICYLIKFDSTHGKFKGTVTYSQHEINVNDQAIKVFHEKQPASVPWHAAGVHYVIEASGMFTNLEKASGHLTSEGVKRVIVTAPSVDVPMVILGVNDHKVNADHKVISCASSTLYCLAPLVRILQETVGVDEGFVTSIHAMTPSLKPLDGLCLRGKHWRDHRSIHQNIIPASTAACKALAKIIPEVKDKLTGLAFRVPIVNVSVLDLTIRLKGNTTLQDIVKNVEKASKTTLKNVIKISNEQAVSSDFIGDSHSCILDVDLSIQLKPNFFKLVCWYENEYSYACRVVDSILFSEKQFRISESPSKMTYVRTRPLKKLDVLLQTDCSRKEKSIECKYSPLNNKLLCSTSQDTGLPSKNKSPRPVILKKPVSSYNSGTSSTINRDSKIRNEVFKIWNDEHEVSRTGSRQNRNSLFHSCVAFGPQNTETDCMKAQERLENVKREFSKMVNITEDLLKKSYSNKFQLNSMLNLAKDECNAVVSENLKKCVKIESTIIFPDCKSLRAKPVVDICGDYNPVVALAESKSSNNCSKEEVELHNEKDMSNYNMTDLKSSDKLDAKISKANEGVPSIIGASRITSKTKQYNENIVKDLSKAKNNYRESFSKNVHVLSNAEKTIRDVGNTTPKNKQSKHEVTTTRYKNMKPQETNIGFDELNSHNKVTDGNIAKADSVKERNISNRMVNIHYKRFNVENTRTENIIEADQGHYEVDYRSPLPEHRQTHDAHSIMLTEAMIDSKQSNKPKMSPNELIERKPFKQEPLAVEVAEIKTVALEPEKKNYLNYRTEADREQTEAEEYSSEEQDNYKVIDEELKKRNITLVANETKAHEIMKYCSMENDHADKSDVKDTALQHQTVDVLSFIQKRSGLIEADSSRTSTENTFSTLSNLHSGRRKQDIYDKLDSVSATDSNNSFEINGRKSQVLHINDVTTSLEDIARLDKICRIIEISDELSDKLFSSLDNGVGTDVKKKRWSFKDLCERIKLDEFCNRVFGKTAL